MATIVTVDADSGPAACQCPHMLSPALRRALSSFTYTEAVNQDGGSTHGRTQLFFNPVWPTFCRPHSLSHLWVT